MTSSISKIDRVAYNALLNQRNPMAEEFDMPQLVDAADVCSLSNLTPESLACLFKRHSCKTNARH